MTFVVVCDVLCVWNNAWVGVVNVCGGIEGYCVCQCVVVTCGQSGAAGWRLVAFGVCGLCVIWSVEVDDGCVCVWRCVSVILLGNGAAAILGVVVLKVCDAGDGVVVLVDV